MTFPPGAGAGSLEKVFLSPLLGGGVPGGGAQNKAPLGKQMVGSGPQLRPKNMVYV